MAIQPSKELIWAIRRYKEGDQMAFGQIYQLSLPYLTKCTANVVNRIAPDGAKELLEDVLQDTYMTIAEKLDTLQSEAAFFQWAGQIATNHALRVWKQDARWRDMEQPVDDMVYEQPDERFIPEDILENKEKQRLIRNMLQQLPAGQYMCLVEYFYNGLKEREIAEKLEMPLGTVKTNLSRAKKKLKEIVQTHEKKHGVKLYSMSWLLALLLWKEIKAAATAAGAATGAVVVQEAAAIYQGGAAAVGAAGAAGSVAAGSASAGAAAAGSATVTGIVVKVVAGILAAAVTIGGAATLLLPKKEEPREKVHYTDVDWEELPVLTASQIESIENALGPLKAGKEAKGEIIPDEPDDDHVPDGVLCNAEFLGDDMLIFSGENNRGDRLEVTVERCRKGWEIQSVVKTKLAKTLYPINDAMREKGIPTVPCGWILTDETGLFQEGAYCYAMTYWRDKLGHVDFYLSDQSDGGVWFLVYLMDPEYPETGTWRPEYIWDGLELNKETLELRQQESFWEIPAVPEIMEPQPVEPEPTEPEPTEPEPPAVIQSYGDVVLTAQTLSYMNRIVDSFWLPAPATGPAPSYKKGSEWFSLNGFVAECAGENGLLQGQVTADGLVVSKADMDAFFLDTLGWAASVNLQGYPEITLYGEDAYLLKNYSGDRNVEIRIHNIYAENADRIRVVVPHDYTSYNCYFERSADSAYGWVLVEVEDTTEPVDTWDVMTASLMDHGVVVPGDSSATLTGISFSGELTMASAEAYIRQYLLKTTGEMPAQVVAEDWGLVANCYYAYMVHVLDGTGAEKCSYVIGTSDSAIAEYLGPDVARTWFEWELVE